MTTQDKTASSGTGPVLAVHSLDHFALTVPDLGEARRFYGEFGLDVRESAAGLELYAVGKSHRWAVIREGGPKHLDYISFGIFEADADAFRAHLEGQGVSLVAPPPQAEPGSHIWFQSPDGIPVEVRVADKCSPSAKTQFTFQSCAPGATSAVPRSRAPRVHPRGLSHFLIFTTDVLRDIDFFSRTLGLKLSDHSCGAVAFLHTPHGSDHHMFALAKSNGPGMHHSSWDVGSVEEVGLGGMHMASKGYVKGWGLGRHVLGANYFYYVQDPWGSWAEYSADIDYIPAGFEWPSADHPPEDSLYLWGPPVPDDFIVNREVSQADA
jgi:catechol 2,3-dioxygenase-like lactoylglutathione lyase family enzyme